MVNKTISIAEKDDEYISSLIDAGYYMSFSAVIVDAIRCLRRERENRGHKVTKEELDGNR